MNSTSRQHDSRATLLLGLYIDGVFGLDETRYWARELNLDPETQQRLMIRCVSALFDVRGELLAA